jgi:hypothetical protein
VHTRNRVDTLAEGTRHPSERGTAADNAASTPGVRSRSSRGGGTAKLIYVTNASLDGYIEDERGAFDWFPPEDEVFASYTDLLRSVGTFLYGPRLYEVMAV